MNSTLAYLRSRRAWLIESLAVWGSDCEAEFQIAAVEKVASETRLGLWLASLGGQLQEVTFSSLVDNRGNNLPEVIKSPAVVIIPRGRQGAFVKTVNGETGFTVARCDGTASVVTVDILVFETGLEGV
jgi:hypothetical protein